MIQHISIMLQAPNIAAAAGAELQEVASEENRTEITGGEHKNTSNPKKIFRIISTGDLTVVAGRTGYINTLTRVPSYSWPKKTTLIRIVNKPGSFNGTAGRSP